jgi:hypothetical protein
MDNVSASSVSLFQVPAFLPVFGAILLAMLAEAMTAVISRCWPLKSSR